MASPIGASPAAFLFGKANGELVQISGPSYVESSVPGYYHAASTTLHPLDRVQDRLCRELGLLPAEALVKYKLAPLKCRRDMALLGLLHRIVLKDAPPQLVGGLPFCASAEPDLTGCAISTLPFFFTLTDSMAIIACDSQLHVVCVLHCSPRTLRLAVLFAVPRAS